MKGQCVNPYLPSYEYMPDGEPYVFGDRLYVFGSHDLFNGEDFCLGDYMGWSAPLSDLSDWRCDGPIFSAKQDPDFDPEKDMRLFAPDCQQGPDGRYYLYYALTREGVIGVAVSDTPAGHYEYYGHVHYPDGTRLGRKADDMFQYDPAVLVDNGRIWLYSGFCFDPVKIPFFSHLKVNRSGAMVIELEQDMVTVKQPPRFLIPGGLNSEGTEFEGHGFFEAASIRKVGEKYYFIYSSEQGHELCYAVSNRPDSDFCYGGTIISNGDLGYQGRTERLNYTGTNHGSIVDVNGQWYVFYHRQTNGHAYSRQGCADRIELAPDGSIAQVQMTSQGLSGGPLPGAGTYCANIACCLIGPDGACEMIPHVGVDDTHPRFTQSGADRDSNPDAYLANLRSGAVAGYRSFVITRNSRIQFVLRGTGSGILEVASTLDGAPIAELPLAATPKWTPIQMTWPLETGTYELWLRYRGEGSMDIRSMFFVSNHG